MIVVLLNLLHILPTFVTLPHIKPYCVWPHEPMPLGGWNRFVLVDCLTFMK